MFLERSMDSINKNKLEQSADIFYRRISGREGKRVRWLVNDLQQFLQEQNCKSFLIAGVGGVLRRSDEDPINDIDLAVVGLKYTTEQEPKTKDFEGFMKTLKEYHSKIIYRMKHDEEVRDIERIGSGSIWVSGSGGRATATDLALSEISTSQIKSSNLDSSIISKGFLIQYSGGAPIDIQFVFNKTPNEWKTDQKVIGEIQEPQGGKSREYFYSILSDYMRLQEHGSTYTQNFVEVNLIK